MSKYGKLNLLFISNIYRPVGAGWPGGRGGGDGGGGASGPPQNFSDNVSFFLQNPLNVPF